MSDSPPSRRPKKNINYEDVDDIIGIASELQQIDAERLSEQDLRAVASDLDLPEHYLGPAIAELDRRRKAAQLAAEARARTKKRLIISAISVFAILSLWAILTNSSLGTELATISQQRAQIDNVLERQRATEAQWRDLPHSDKRAAELSGAENRVRIERKRYDEVAAAYNGRVSSFPTSLWASLFGRPKSVPLSTEFD
jgi:hypothetical protein